MRLLENYRLGELCLPSRVVMPAMTRNRAAGTIPQPVMATYYAQRAGAGLVIAEAAQVDVLGQGYPDTPGLHTEAQRVAWRHITDAVHATGGRIFAQLSHVGRISHRCYHGDRPVAPSAVVAPGDAYTPSGPQPYETPRALTTDEVRDVVAAFGRAAYVAKEAGFDGVEIHGANGYLVDQFLQSGANQRADRYGGSVERRARFLLEVTEAALHVWGEGRVAVRLSPAGTANGMWDADPVGTFSHAARALDGLGLAFLHVVEGAVRADATSGGTASATDLLRCVYSGTLVSTGGYTPESGEAAVASGRADLIGFGRLFIANPDLPERIRRGSELNAPDRATFYSGGVRGYTDYPRRRARWPLPVR